MRVRECLVGIRIAQREASRTDREGRVVAKQLMFVLSALARLTDQ